MANMNVVWTAEGKEYFRKLAELAAQKVCVGYNADSGNEENGTPVVEVAYYNNYGTVSENGQVAIPARPFMNAVVGNHCAEIQQFAAQQLEAMANNSMDSATAMQHIGAKMKTLTQMEIRDGGWIPNSPATIRRKGSSRPLIDNGTMRQNVQIVIKGEEE